MKRFTLVLIVFGCAAFASLRYYQNQLRELENNVEGLHEKLPAEFDSFVKWSASIRPLYEKKRPPEPGDWLEKYPEGGQTFAQYVAFRGKQPVQAEVSTIYVQPFGEFDATQEKIVAQTADFMQRYFGLPVKLLPAQPTGEIPPEFHRIRNRTEQVEANWIMRHRLLPEMPADAVAMIGLVTCDLWEGNFNWVYGFASIGDRVGVWSLHRNGDPHASESARQLCLIRTLKTAVHETGHILGIHHCIAYECCMNGTKSQEENDRKPIEFCPECLPKICWACQTNPADRSQQLGEFAKSVGMKKEARFWNTKYERLHP